MSSPRRESAKHVLNPVWFARLGGAAFGMFVAEHFVKRGRQRTATSLKPELCRVLQSEATKQQNAQCAFASVPRKDWMTGQSRRDAVHDRRRFGREGRPGRPKTG